MARVAKVRQFREDVEADMKRWQEDGVPALGGRKLPAPGPTRHPPVTDRDVTWFIWTYAVVLVTGGVAIGAAAMLLIRG